MWKIAQPALSKAPKMVPASPVAAHMPRVLELLNLEGLIEAERPA